MTDHKTGNEVRLDTSVLIGAYIMYRYTLSYDNRRRLINNWRHSAKFKKTQLSILNKSLYTGLRLEHKIRELLTHGSRVTGPLCVTGGSQGFDMIEIRVQVHLLGRHTKSERLLVDYNLVGFEADVQDDKDETCTVCEDEIRSQESPGHHQPVATDAISSVE